MERYDMTITGVQGVPGSWRWMVGLPIIPGLALALAPLVLPESPRWLVMAGDLPSALAALHHLRCPQVRSPPRLVNRAELLGWTP